MVHQYKLFGINFIQAEYEGYLELLKKGSLMVVPAAPALATINEDKKYYKALKNADFAIPDSGLMTLLLRIFFRKKINKFSGYLFLKEFINDESLKYENSVFLIDPSTENSHKNNQFLKENNFKISKEFHYAAPMYDKNNITDYELLKILDSKKPDYILINLGGGVQERLGLFLRNKLSYKPGIICTGAAIAFFTGDQAKISNWIDKYYLGWLIRCIYNPKIFIPRYIKGLKLTSIFFKEIFNKKKVI